MIDWGRHIRSWTSNLILNPTELTGVLLSTANPIHENCMQLSD